jgi:hypothetical protein
MRVGFLEVMSTITYVMTASNTARGPTQPENETLNDELPQRETKHEISSLSDRRAELCHSSVAFFTNKSKPKLANGLVCCESLESERHQVSTASSQYAR